jgi:hypothetical protein
MKMKPVDGYFRAIAWVVSAGPAMATVHIQEYTLDTPALHSQTQELNNLQATVRFTWNDALADVLIIDLTNSSTGVPAGFSNSDQILTGISFDLGAPMIIGGSVVLAPGGTSFNMDTPVTGGADLSGEWGYGNTAGTGLLAHSASTLATHAVPFGGLNLDGPENLDGPQAGITTNPPLILVDGLGVVAESIIITLQLDMPLEDLLFVERGIIAEFGSDAAHVTPIPEPATGLLMIGTLVLLRRR